ncbi:MAG: Iron utilization protein match [Pseudonocardiales bacterium]|nr:Iron utilization protein match [Pseudonocardiales bacterium]
MHNDQVSAPLATEIPPAPARRKLPPKFHSVTVKAIEELTPRMRRITFTGPDLATYPNDGPGSHFKILLAAPGVDKVEVPEMGPNGEGWPPTGPDAPLRRTFTPRLVDTDAQELVIDFALHGDHGGPASQWATDAKIGDAVVVTGGRGPYRISPDAPWTLIVGDETALPAIATILEDAPTAAVVLLIEVDDASDEIDLPLSPGSTLTWVHRGGRTAGHAVVDAVAAASLPEGAGNAWVGIEAASMRAVRRQLIADRGFTRDRLATRAYWKFDAPGYRDGDTGEDVDATI